MNDKIAKELLEYIAKNHKLSDPFLSPFKESAVETTGLLDKIAELRGIDKIKNGEEFNAIIEKLEQKL